MRNLFSMLLITATLVLVSGCSYMKAMKTFSPETFGMEKISDYVYVNPEMSKNSREKILEYVKESRKNIVAIYGGVKSTPDVIACSTEECYRKFGGVTSKAKNYGGVSFLLSPRGMTAPLITHEWSHNELYTRLDSFWYYRNIPQWFDEGLAVVASKEPTHSDEVWRYILKHNIPKPSLDNLVSLNEWHKAISKYGVLANKGNNPGKISVVYATAGHEVRKWYKCVEKSGVLEIINLIQSGHEFSYVYESIKRNSKCKESI